MTPERPQVNPLGRYTIIKAAQALGVTSRTIYRWIDNGTIEEDETGMHRYGHKGTFVLGRAILRVWEAADFND